MEVLQVGQHGVHAHKHVEQELKPEQEHVPTLHLNMEVQIVQGPL